MNFKYIIFSSLKILLFPISIAYGCVIRVRNFLFDKKVLRSVNFDLPIICVGNIAVGGTGKTPMVEYLLKLLSSQNSRIATISRGYKRKTKGFFIADSETTSKEIGDEPMQFHTKFPNVNVCVGEDRVNAVKQLLRLKPDTETIILDDAFQHRKIAAGLNILLTDFNQPFYRDCFLPSGNLRDQRRSADRADTIIVTKCPADLSNEDKNKIINQLNAANQTVFFTTIKYGNPYHISNSERLVMNEQTHYLLVHGIANATSLKNYISLFDENFDEIKFGDHHHYTLSDVRKIIATYQTHKNAVIITTEKDAAKLKNFSDEFSALPLYVLPIEIFFLFKEQEKFDSLIKNSISRFNK
jgi:tetraacyldisaccharide 4'-kinase